MRVERALRQPDHLLEKSRIRLPDAEARRGRDDVGRQRSLPRPPLERLGQPDDIANVVSFLAGPDGAWVNAQVLRANGGFA